MNQANLNLVEREVNTGRPEQVQPLLGTIGTLSHLYLASIGVHIF